MRYKCPKCGCDELCISTENATTPFDWDYRCNNCDSIFPTEEAIKIDDRTLFEQITESPETLAEKLVFYSDSFNKPAELVNGSIVICNWESLITGKFYWTKSEAIAATIKKLKEVVE